MLRYVVAVCAVSVIGTARCDGPASTEPTGQRHVDRRSVGGDHHHHGLLYAPSYYGHYAPAAYPAGHYYAPHYHVHGLPDHHAHGYAGSAYYHAAGGHYHFGHEAAVHGRHPIVHQSVVNTYPTATAVVHKPVPVAVPVAHPVPVPVDRPVPVAHPVPVPVDRPVPVPHPVPVPVDRPVPVEVPRPYPVPVNRPYPVAVVRPVPVPVAQPYPVYRPYPVPAYRPPVARPVAAVRLPVAVRAPPLHVRYLPQPASYVHSHRVYAAPHAHVYAPAHSYGYATLARPYRRGPPSPVYPAAGPAAVPSYLQQLTAVRGAQEGAEYDDATEAAAAQQQQQQQAFQEDYQQFGQQDVADDSAIRYRQEQQLQIGQDGGYPSLTADDSFKTTGSLGVPSTDYAAKKK